MSEPRGEDRPFEGGAQPVPELPPEVPTKGRTLVQTVVLIVAALVVAAAILWFVVPLAG